MKKFITFIGLLLALAVPLAWWYSAIAPYSAEIERTTAEITLSFVAVASLVINVIGVAAWLQIVPRIGDYIVGVFREIYMLVHWRRVRARAEARRALADDGPVLTDDEQSTIQARQLVLELLRAAMDVEGPAGVKIPRWDSLEGWGSKTWQQAIGYIRRHLVISQGGRGGGGTSLAAGYPSLRAFYKMVERGSIALAQDDDKSPLPDDENATTTA